MIRSPLLSDIAEIARLNQIVHAMHADKAPTRFKLPAGPETFIAWFTPILQAQDSFVVVAEVSGKVVGYLYAKEEKKAESWVRPAAHFFMLHHIAVNPAFQRDGYGSNLMNALFAIRLPAGDLIGAISLGINLPNQMAELGYWIGMPFWNKGFCTDAARRVLQFGFDELGLNKIYARHLGGNTGSARVMQKIGMTKEGMLRQHVMKYGVLNDIVEYGILKSEYEKLQTKPIAKTCVNPPANL